MPHIRHAIDFLGSHTGSVLVALLIIVAGLWGFVELTDEVVEGETHAFDHRLIDLATRHEGPTWLQIMGRDVTALGGVAVLSGVTVVVAAYLALRRKYHLIVLLIVATAGGAALNSQVKHFVGRERPPEENRLVPEMSKSFPSGHAMLSATVYLTLGALLASTVKERSLKAYFLGVAVFVTIVVGVSRVYLRVHWPTDVLAGWTAGFVWATLLWVVTKLLQRRGVVEPEDDANESTAT
jgi:undecaprenyl-diphosphatase